MKGERDSIRRDQTIWRKKLKGAIQMIQEGAFRQKHQPTEELPIVRQERIKREERAEVETPEAYPGNIIWLEEYRKLHK